MSAPDLPPGLVEAVAEAIWNWDEGAPRRPFPTHSKYAEVHCDVRDIAARAVAAMVEHLGLTWQNYSEVMAVDRPLRRLVGPWREAQP